MLYGNLWELKQTQKSDKLITLNHLNQSGKEGVMNKTMTLTKSAIVVSLFFIMFGCATPSSVQNAPLHAGMVVHLIRGLMQLLKRHEKRSLKQTWR